LKLKLVGAARLPVAIFYQEARLTPIARECNR